MKAPSEHEQAPEPVARSQALPPAAGQAAAAVLPASRLLGRLVLATAALLALVLPGMYLAIGYSAVSSSLQTKADIKAEVINQAIGASPQMWRFEEHRLGELLRRFPIELQQERGHIVADDGEVVAATEHALPWPVIQRSGQLFDSGTWVGRVVLQRSISGLVAESALCTLLGLALGRGLLLGLRRAQRRERELAQTVFNQTARARVTLQSIGDAVITTDLGGRIDYMNPVAEQLTQWPLDQARGRPLAEVCALVDEATMQTLAPPVEQAMKDGWPRAFSGKDVALLRRDGLSLAVEDSAAPIVDEQGRVMGGVMVMRDVSAARRLARRINWAATHDALTGLVNRHEFEACIDRALLSARQADQRHVLCCLNLDQFKIVNDSCGHAAGDELLKQVAGLLQGKLRGSDSLARLGGDEFGLLLEDCSLASAQPLAAELLASVRGLRLADAGRGLGLGMSVGMVALGRATTSRAEAMIGADLACQRAKEQGRHRVCVFHSNDSELAQRRTDMGWATRLSLALEEQRFRLYFQPYQALTPGGAGGLHIEILLRLVDEQGHLVEPGSFIPAAERYGLMPAIDRWVIGEVFSRYKRLRGQMGAELTCAINLSGTTLNDEGTLAYIAEQARLHALPPGAICFEITETAAIDNLQHAARFMHRLKALGFGFALDDFGIGSSSLAYLKTLPVDYLKIDGSFVRNIATDPVDRAMADTINRVGHIMGLRTVGEFAESQEVIDALRALGVDFAQGYGVQRPQPLPGARLPAQTAQTAQSAMAVPAAAALA